MSLRTLAYFVWRTNFKCKHSVVSTWKHRCWCCGDDQLIYNFEGELKYAYAKILYFWQRFSVSWPMQQLESAWLVSCHSKLQYFSTKNSLSTLWSSWCRWTPNKRTSTWFYASSSIHFLYYSSCFHLQFSSFLLFIYSKQTEGSETTTNTVLKIQNKVFGWCNKLNLSDFHVTLNFFILYDHARVFLILLIRMILVLLLFRVI